MHTAIHYTHIQTDIHKHTNTYKSKYTDTYTQTQILKQTNTHTHTYLRLSSARTNHFSLTPLISWEKHHYSDQIWCRREGHKVSCSASIHCYSLSAL